MEESWCLAWGSLGHRFCHCPQLPLRIPSLPSAPPLCGRPQLRGIPCYPASLMKSDTRPEDLIYTATGPLPPLFCPHWLWWFTLSCSDENAAIPKRHYSPNHRRSSEGRANCMESRGPNCLYSWAVWLILGEMRDSNCPLILRISYRAALLMLSMCGSCICGRALLGEISNWQFLKGIYVAVSSISLAIIHVVFLSFLTFPCR